MGKKIYFYYYFFDEYFLLHFYCNFLLRFLFLYDKIALKPRVFTNEQYFKETQKTIDTVRELPLYLESKELYGGKNEKEIIYFKSLMLLQGLLTDLTYVQADNELFNYILNIHISKFEAENKDAVLKIKSFDNIVKGIDTSRDKKQRTQSKTQKSNLLSIC